MYDHSICWVSDRYCLLFFVPLIILIDDQVALTNANVFGQGNLEFSQGKIKEFYFLKFMRTLLNISGIHDVSKLYPPVASFVFC